MGRHAPLGVASPEMARCAANPVPGHGHDITHHRGSSRGTACPLPEEHQLPSLDRLNEDGVVGAGDGRERMGFRNHRGMNLDDHPVVPRQLGHGQQLDDASHLVRGRDIGFSHRGDSLTEDLRAMHLGVEGQAREDGSLRRSVLALYVGCRIRLREAEFLGLAQSDVEAQVSRRHLVEDVVRGAVDDAHHGTDLVSHQRFPKRPDDRDCARDGSLVVQIDTIFLRRSC